jgi:hypothetical protein
MLGCGAAAAEGGVAAAAVWFRATSRGDGTGIRGGLKNRWAQALAGSNPAPGTNPVGRPPSAAVRIPVERFPDPLRRQGAAAAGARRWRCGSRWRWPPPPGRWPARRRPSQPLLHVAASRPHAPRLQVRWIPGPHRRAGVDGLRRRGLRHLRRAAGRASRQRLPGRLGRRGRSLVRGRRADCPDRRRGVPARPCAAPGRRRATPLARRRRARGTPVGRDRRVGPLFPDATEKSCH